MDHARVSELLSAYERGELGAADVRTVDAHVRECPDCAQELRGLKALNASSVEPLTHAERAVLRERIAAAVAEDATQTVIAPPRSAWWVRFGPALAGAATIALVVSGVAFLGWGGGLDSSGDAAGGGTGSGAPESVEGDGGADAGGRATAGGSAAVFAGDLGEITSQALTRDTRERTLRGLPDRLTGLSPYASEAQPASEDGSDTLSGEAAPSPNSNRHTRRTMANLGALQIQTDRATGRQIAECVATVTEEFPFPSVPVYAATATLDGDRVLVVGFTWRKSPDARGREFMVWAWPIGDCRVPVFYGSSTPPR